MNELGLFFKELGQYPGLLWLITTTFCWVTLILLRKDIVEGLKGQDKLWEASEVIAFVFILLSPPVVSYAIYFKSMDTYAWIVLGGILLYMLMGKWAFKWILAFKTGQSKVEENKEEQQ